MDKITLFDKNFQLYIPASEISEIISEIADSLNKMYATEKVVFLCVLNGAFMFFSELIKQIEFNCEISFIKLASYNGTVSNGNAKMLFGLNENLENKIVIIVEDIIETGLTLDEIKNHIATKNPKDTVIVSLFHKPEKYKAKSKIDFTGRTIDNDFIVGFGLDYNGYGRNLKDIYKLYNA